MAEKESSGPARVPRRFVRACGEGQIGFDDKKNSPDCSGLFFGGEGGTRTLAPVLDRPTPLAGAPRHQLEYFSRLVSGFHLSSIFIYRAEETIFVSLSTARDFSGGEGGIRTHGSCESLVFKTSSLNHSDTSPSSNENNFTTGFGKCQQLF